MMRPWIWFAYIGLQLFCCWVHGGGWALFAGVAIFVGTCFLLRSIEKEEARNAN
jgi:hypothetical protein